jgi:hypothetical protein
MSRAEANTAKLAEAQALLALVAANPDLSTNALRQSAVSIRFAIRVQHIERRKGEQDARLALDVQRATAYLATLDAGKGDAQ